MNIYPENFENKIGFDKIRELLSSRCLSEMGKEHVAACDFTSDADLIEKQLDETVEFQKIIRDEFNFPTGYFIDMRSVLRKSKIQGTFLEVFELFDLKRSLETLRSIANFFKEKEQELFPRLYLVVKGIQIYPFLYDRIDQILTKLGTIKDNASPELVKIRREILSLQAGISKIMAKILKHAQAEGLVEKDVTVSIRDGRAVIPVLSSNKRKMRGIVHDESATGRTSYIEPEEIVETNNRIRELESAERREIVRILTKFTDELRPYAEELEGSYEILGILDFIRAKGLWSNESKSVKPLLKYDTELNWIDARHPLLERNLAREKRKIVPLNIKLSKDDRILLISGPNAGGKSVCLKTVGLLQYSIQCGVPIPLHLDSVVGIFDKIFIDIGDNQSLDNDLSTYSSHLSDMKFFVRNCNPKSLVLIDEFGTGTEPMLGGAIAESILNRINNLESYGVITTHYTNLKHFASSVPGIVNGAMLYDSNKMEPLFQLQIGKPGSSFAFEIARKIGLPEDILQEATDKIGKDHIDFDKHLRDIVRDKRYWETKRQNIRQSEKKLEDLTSTYEENLSEVKKLRKEILDKAKKEATEILASSNKIVEQTIREIKEASAEKEKTKEVRKKLEEFKEVLSTAKDSEDEQIVRKMEKIRQREISKRERPQKEEPIKAVVEQPAKKDEPEVGSWIKIQGQEAPGIILEIHGTNLVVAFGQLRSVVKRDRVELISHNEVKKTRENYTTSQVNREINDRKLNFKPRIDVRGMRAEEGLQKIQEFIDEAIMVEAHELHILHGKGNGILRELIRAYLKSEPAVKKFRDEHVQFGGSGITIVEM
ncbi:MAG: Smr/MutS family protein [Bacteroidia bacterium]|nr:Smr/MutS family protein [Bacteroidia bacterium]